MSVRFGWWTLDHAQLRRPVAAVLMRVMRSGPKHQLSLVDPRARCQFAPRAITVELVRKLQDAGAVFTEVGVHHYRRVYGTSEFFTIPAVARTLRDLAKLWIELVVLRRGRAHGAR